MANKKLLALVILDGFGINNFQNGNAPLLADMQNIKNIHHAYPWVLLDASSESVGLIENAYGTCQDGHLTIGSGRVQPSYLQLIQNDIKTKVINQKEQLLQLATVAKERNKKYVHVIASITKSPIIGYEDDAIALMEFLHDHGLKSIVHVITDGFDVKKKSAILYMNNLKAAMDKYGAELADISGRFYALNTNQNWKRTIRAWNMMSNHEGDGFTDWRSFIEEQYSHSLNDEFFIPSFNMECEVGQIQDDDVVLFTPYRYGDQLLSLMINTNLEEANLYNPIKRSNLYVTTITPYSDNLNLPHVYPLIQLDNTLGEVLANNNIKQLRIAESLRINDVTFMFDGRKDIELQQETITCLESPKVLTYDLKPQLNAVEITNAILKDLDNYDFIVANYANPDILGHTGNLDAAIKACKVLDLCIGSLFDEIVQKRNGTLVICADHGNCEQMVDEEGNNKTYHTNNKVPFILCDRDIHLRDDDANLADIAPTILDYLQISIPKEMTGKTLIKNPSFFERLSDRFKKQKIQLDIVKLSDEELNKILNVESKYNSNIKYEDENDFALLDV